jgi:hypothetical protein
MQLDVDDETRSKWERTSEYDWTHVLLAYSEKLSHQLNQIPIAKLLGYGLGQTQARFDQGDLPCCQNWPTLWAEFAIHNQYLQNFKHVQMECFKAM